MPGPICRILVDGDVGGPSGKILGPGATSVLAGFLPVSLMGDKVGPHGTAPHAKATLLFGAFRTITEGRFTSCVGGSIGTCGHPAVKGYTRVIIS